MIVKICGIKTVEAALAVRDAGADMIGFVFAESKRKVTVEEATLIAQKLPNHLKKVGVFVNESLENIIKIAETVNLDYVQLHGDESPEFCQQVPYPVIKAFSMKKHSDLTKLSLYDCDFYLLDSPGVKYAGGSGIPFDWNLLTNHKIPREKVILAGGLNEANVREAIDVVKPVAIDVSSGVETDGEKDIKKIFAFVERAKQGNVEVRGVE